MEYKNDKLELRSRYYYRKLDLKSQYVYRAMYSKWSKGYSDIELIIDEKFFINHKVDYLLDIASYVLNENPQIFHIDRRRIEMSLINNKASISVNGIYTREEYEELYKCVMQVAVGLLKRVPDEVPYVEKMKIIHDLLARNIVYTMGDGNVKNEIEVHSIIGALLNKKCVCEGFAKAFQLLCEMCAMHCTIISGEGCGGTDDEYEPHAWNLVWIDDVPYHVDVTWDNNKGSKEVSDIYFLRNDDFMRKTHKWNESEHSSLWCEKDYPRKEPLIRGKKELKQYMLEQIANGKSYFACWLGGAFPDEAGMKRILRDWISYDVDSNRCQGITWSFDKKIGYLEVWLK